MGLGRDGRNWTAPIKKVPEEARPKAYPYVSPSDLPTAFCVLCPRPALHLLVTLLVLPFGFSILGLPVLRFAHLLCPLSIQYISI